MMYDPDPEENTIYMMYCLQKRAAPMQWRLKFEATTKGGALHHEKKKNSLAIQMTEAYDNMPDYFIRLSLI